MGAPTIACVQTIAARQSPAAVQEGETGREGDTEMRLGSVFSLSPPLLVALSILPCCPGSSGYFICWNTSVGPALSARANEKALVPACRGARARQFIVGQTRLGFPVMPASRC